MRGVFVCGAPDTRSAEHSVRVQVSLVQENIDRMTIPCISLVDMVDYPPDSGRLEQKNLSRDVF